MGQEQISGFRVISLNGPEHSDHGFLHQVIRFEQDAGITLLDICGGDPDGRQNIFNQGCFEKDSAGSFAGSSENRSSGAGVAGKNDSSRKCGARGICSQR